MLGGARAQNHLRQTFIFLNMYPINTPEVIVTFAQNKFDANGKLTEDTRRFLKQLLENLANWTRRDNNKASCLYIMHKNTNTVRNRSKANYSQVELYLISKIKMQTQTNL